MKVSLLTLAGLSLAAASALPAALHASGGSSITLPLLTAGGYYFAEISVGTPAQSFHIAVDTGSTNMCLVDSSCEGCEAPSKLNAKASSTYVASDKQINSAYTAGSMQGKLGTDVIKVGNQKLSQGFVAMTGTKAFVAAISPGSGIMGLAPINAASTSNGQAQAGVPFWVTMARTGAIAAPIFTVQLTRRTYQTSEGPLGSAARARKAAELQPGGVFTLGAIDSKQYTGPITYANCGYANAWIIRFDFIKLDGTMISVPSNNTEAAIDTGSPFILGPRAVVEAIYAKIPGAEKDGPFYSIPCDTTSRFSVSFGGKEWAVNPADLTLEQLGRVKNGKQICRGTFFPAEDDGHPPSWIFGAPFLNNVLSVFEASVGGHAPRVGFAKLKSASS